MSNRSRICTTLAGDSSGVWLAQTNGSGENFRLSLWQKVHAGPKDSLNREVALVLSANEVLDLAIMLLGQTPSGAIEELPQPKRDLLNKYLKVITTQLTPSKES